MATRQCTGTVWPVLAVLVAMLPAAVVVSEGAPAFEVGGHRFEAPAEWRRLPPKSTLRKAEFLVPGLAGGGDGYCVFYHFPPGAGGGIEANITRWRRQFREPAEDLQAQTELVSRAGHRLHYFEASGTFLAGRPGGAKREVPNHSFFGVIIEGPGGNVFIRLVVPDGIRAAARVQFRRMAESPFES